jgi:hypothetical protein
MEARPSPPQNDTFVPVRLTRYRVLACFLVGLLALDGVVRLNARLWDDHDPNEYAERLARCRGRAWDLVVLGGSPVAEGVDPAILRGLNWRGQIIRRVYNLGLSGGTASEFWHALEHGVTVRPKLLVYGITASDLNDNRNETHGPSELMELGDLARWLAERPDSRAWLLRQYGRACLERCWGLYEYRNGIRLWAAHRVDEICPGLFPQVAAEVHANVDHSETLARGHGYAPQASFQEMRYSRTKASGGKVAPFPFLEGFRLGHHLACVHRIRAWADRHKVDLVLVDMPMSADLEARHASVFLRYRRLLRDLQVEHGFRVLHGDREAVGLDDDHFADLAHLNQWGADRFGHWLRTALSYAAVEK